MANDPHRDSSALANRGREPLRLWFLLLLLPGAILAFFGLPFGLRTLAVEAFEAEGASMEPTICHGERFAVDKNAYGIFLPFRRIQSVGWRMPQLGEVVIIKGLANGRDLIKRVVGVPGDRIESRELEVLRNGVSLTEQLVDCPAHLKPATSERKCYVERVGEHRYTVLYSRPAAAARPLKVPKDRLYVLGDHRDASKDSRNPLIGTIGKSLMIGRATRIYWSDHRDRIGQVIE